MNNFKVMMNGIIKENPTFVLLLGMCPTLGTTSSAINGMGMGLATMFVLICSNVVISLIKNLIPDMVRIPSFIVVIASFVTLLQMVMQAYVPGLYATLGLFIPLIVVNCIVLGRAEAFAAYSIFFSYLIELSFLETINQCDEISQGDESTRSQYEHQHSVFFRQDSQVEDLACSQKFADSTQQSQGNGKAQSHTHAVDSR